MTESTQALLDQERDVLIMPLDATLKFAHARKRERGRRSERSHLWNVFLGAELIECLDNRDGAIDLARKVSTRSRRPAWISTDGVQFDPIAKLTKP